MYEQVKELQKVKRIGKVISRRLVEPNHDTIAGEKAVLL